MVDPIAVYYFQNPYPYYWRDRILEQKILKLTKQRDIYLLYIYSPPWLVA